MKKCYYCKSKNKELRPYGPGKSYVCYDCAMKTPERKKETEMNYEDVLEKAIIEGHGKIEIGSEEGPQPHRRQD